MEVLAIRAGVAGGGRMGHCPGRFGQDLAWWPVPAQWKHRPSAMRRPRSSGDTVLLAAERSMGPGCVPVAVVGIT